MAVPKKIILCNWIKGRPNFFHGTSVEKKTVRKMMDYQIVFLVEFLISLNEQVKLSLQGKQQMIFLLLIKFEPWRESKIWKTWVLHSELYTFSALTGFSYETGGDINLKFFILYNEMSQHLEDLNKSVN